MKKGIWLGFVFFVALVLLGFGTLLVGNIDLFKESHVHRIHFATVEGLKAGDDIRVEGVHYGKVSAIALDPRGGVMVTVDLSGPIEIYEGYEIYVEAFTILGGNYISVKRGNLRGRKLDANDVLKGEARASAITEVGQIAQDNRTTIHELLSNIRDVTQTIKEGKGSVGKFINDDALHEDLRVFLKLGREQVEGMVEMSRQMKSMFEGGGEGPVKELLHNREMADQVKSAVHSMKEIAASLERVTANIEKGEGLAGAVMNNKEVEGNFKRTLENIEAVTEKMKQLTVKVENSTVGRLLQDDSIYRKAEQSLDDVDALLGSAARSKLWLETESRSYFESDMTVTRLGIRIEPDDSKYFWASAAFLGLSEKGDIVTFEDQLSKGKDQTIIVPDVGLAYRVPWFLDNRLTVKAGLLEGKPGGALEFLWEDWGAFKHPVLFVLEARDAYNSVEEDDIDENIDGGMFRAWVKTSLWGKPDRWWEEILQATKLYAGASRIGDDDMDFFAGLGLEWEDKDIRSLVSLLGIAN